MGPVWRSTCLYRLDSIQAVRRTAAGAAGRARAERVFEKGATAGRSSSAGNTAGQASSDTQMVCRAEPIDRARPRSPWIVVPEELKTDLVRLTGPSDYTANLGANSGGANGVYWVEIKGEVTGAPLRSAPATRPTVSSGTQVVIRNLADVGKRTVEQVEAMLERRYPTLREAFVTTIARLAAEVNESFVAADARTRVSTPMSLRSVLDRIPAGLWMYADAEDPLRRTWEEFVLNHIDPYDTDHYETVWNAVARRGPEGPPFGK